MDAQALGRYLRESREAKEISLDQAEQALRIRRRILESFELGEFNIPEFAGIEIRGFIRNYARYLGLDEDRVVAYYEGALMDSTKPRRLSGRSAERRGKKDKHDSQTLIPVAPRKATDTPPSLPTVTLTSGEARRGTSFATVLLRLLVAVAAVGVIAYVVVQLLQTNQTPPVPQGDILGDLPTAPTNTLQPTSEVLLLPTSPPNLQPNFSGQGLLVTLQLSERSWLRISTDGTEQYVGIAIPGTRLEYPAGDNVTVIASNAQALDAVFNGQQQASFGGRGQMVTVVFNRGGVSIDSGPGYAPTPEFSATPLPTPTDAAGALVAQLTPTITEVPSPTPSDTPSPTDTPTITPTPSETPIPSDTPTPTLTPTDTLTPSPTLTFTLTPSETPIPTATPIPSDTPIPTATSILPPREIPSDATATKVGR